MLITGCRKGYINGPLGAFHPAYSAMGAFIQVGYFRLLYVVFPAKNILWTDSVAVLASVAFFGIY